MIYRSHTIKIALDYGPGDFCPDRIKLGKYFDLRLIPSLAFGERYLDYYMAAWDETEVSFVEIRKNVTSAHIDIPLHVRYRSKRAHNFGAYVLAGGAYVLDLAATRTSKKEADNEKSDNSKRP